MPRVIVTLGSDISVASMTEVSGPLKRVRRGNRLPLIKGYAVTLSDEDIAKLRRAGLDVQPDEEVGIPPFPQVPVRPAGGGYPTEELDPDLPGTMQQMIECEVEEAHGLGFMGEGIRVGIADTGVDANHPDLAGKLFSFKDFTGGLDEPADLHGHGTACAGMVVGTGAVVSKFRGVAPAATYSMAQVMAENGYGYSSWIIKGLGWLAEQGVDVVSVSLGSTNTKYTALSRALDRLVKDGIVVVVAAGNSGPGRRIGQPGNAYGAICCAACDWDGQYSDFSSLGPATGVDGIELVKPDVMAWGKNVSLLRAAGTSNGTILNDHYIAWAGTSFSTPFVAGLAALYLEAQASSGDYANTDSFKTAIMSSAHDSPLYLANEEGMGAVRIVAAMKHQYKATPPPSPIPPSGCWVAMAGLGWSVPSL